MQALSHHIYVAETVDSSLNEVVRETQVVGGELAIVPFEVDPVLVVNTIIETGLSGFRRSTSKKVARKQGLGGQEPINQLLEKSSNKNRERKKVALTEKGEIWFLKRVKVGWLIILHRGSRMGEFGLNHFE